MSKEYYLIQNIDSKEENRMIDELTRAGGGTIYIMPKASVFAHWERFTRIPNVFIVGLPKK